MGCHVYRLWWLPIDDGRLMECDRYFLLEWRSHQVSVSHDENGHEGERGPRSIGKKIALYCCKRMLGWEIPRVSDLPNSQVKLVYHFWSMDYARVLVVHHPPPPPQHVLMYQIQVIEANSRLASFRSSGWVRTSIAVAARPLATRRAHR